MSGEALKADDLVERINAERDRHVIGYPGPRRDVAELLDLAAARIIAVEAERDALEQKLAGIETCACSYDAPDEICLHHSPALVKAEAQLKAAREALDAIADTDEIEAILDPTRLIRIAGAVRRAALTPEPS